MFTDSYGEQSCTAGRSSFITGQSVYRTGLSKVGVPAAPIGMSLPGVIKHLAILEDAGLIERKKVGRVVTCQLKAGAMKAALEWLEKQTTPETYERIRVGSSFERVISNLRRLTRMKAASKQSTPQVQIVVVLMRQIKLHLPTSTPDQAIFTLILGRLPRLTV